MDKEGVVVRTFSTTFELDKEINAQLTVCMMVECAIDLIEVKKKEEVEAFVSTIPNSNDLTRTIMRSSIMIWEKHRLSELNELLSNEYKLLEELKAKREEMRAKIGKELESLKQKQRNIQEESL